MFGNAGRKGSAVTTAPEQGGDQEADGDGDQEEDVVHDEEADENELGRTDIYRFGMRGLTSDPDLQPRRDDLLTTGEAAKILNCTRQHVVDLCDRGDLPYTTVGTHRRITRENVEALKTRTDRLSRDERRSLWLAYVVAGRIATEPERTIADALDHLDKMRPNARGQAKKWLDEWERLLDGPVDRILAALTDRSLRGRELRQNSPFAGALTEEQRRRALEAWRAHDVGNPRGRHRHHRQPGDPRCGRRRPLAGGSHDVDGS